MSWLRPNTRGPSFLLIPKRMIICFAVCVTFSRSLAATDDRDLVDVGLTVEVVADDRVAELVVCGDLPLLLGEETRLLLGAGDHAHDPFLELVLLDHLLAAARREQRSLVDEVRQVGAGESGSAGSQ